MGEESFHVTSEICDGELVIMETSSVVAQIAEDHLIVEPTFHHLRGGAVPIARRSKESMQHDDRGLGIFTVLLLSALGPHHEFGWFTLRPGFGDRGGVAQQSSRIARTISTWRVLPEK